MTLFSCEFGLLFQNEYISVIDTNVCRHSLLHMLNTEFICYYLQLHRHKNESIIIVITLKKNLAYVLSDTGSVMEIKKRDLCLEMIKVSLKGYSIGEFQI